MDPYHLLHFIRFSPSPYSQSKDNKYTDWSPTGGHPEPSVRETYKPDKLDVLFHENDSYGDFTFYLTIEMNEILIPNEL